MGKIEKRYISTWEIQLKADGKRGKDARMID